ncbi:MAG: helix-turn-helix domain-containing protein [Thermoplasmata archaeon]|nr:helix-turn-helix domain-containing protein [Thermoplasmata archaeon]
MRRAPTVKLHRNDRYRLLRIAEGRTVSPRVALRARMVLRAARGATNREIAREFGTVPATVARWRQRFLVHGVAGIAKDAPRLGRPPTIPPSQVEAAVRATFARAPTDAVRWSTRSLARELGLSKSTVQRIWKARGIDPRRRPRPGPPDQGLGFVGRVTDLVGVYLSLFERVVAFSADERLTFSALPAHSRRRPPAERPPDRAAQLLAFLKVADRETPHALDVHLVIERRSTPVPAPVQRWLTLHPRFHLHALPAEHGGHDFFDNLIEGFARRRTTPSGLANPHRLQNALREHFRGTRGSPRPFVWTATADEIRGVRPHPYV